MTTTSDTTTAPGGPATTPERDRPQIGPGDDGVEVLAGGDIATEYTVIRVGWRARRRLAARQRDTARPRRLRLRLRRRRTRAS